MLGVLITFISTLISIFKRRRNLALENLALRQQLAVFKRRHPRPKLQPTDRLFWVWLSKLWADWREALIIVKPETVIAWHRQAFRFYWRWLSRRKSIGRPTVSAEVRNVDQADGPSQSAEPLDVGNPVESGRHRSNQWRDYQRWPRI